MRSSAAKGIFTPRNLEKFVGSKLPTYRSSWEMTFMHFCDNNPAIEQWASEPLQIPYRDPLTGKPTVYVPDFLITYVDRNKKKHVELIEIKPMNQMLKEKVGKNPHNQAQFVKNQVKWAAAGAWCKKQGIQFRVISERDIFHNGSKK